MDSPLVSKEWSDRIASIRRNPDSVRSRKALGVGEFQENRYILPKKWKYLINEPYDVSPMCCRKLKKQPSHAFEKETGLAPIIGIMASESMLREKMYIKAGACNTFGENAKSLPLSIWTDDDIWEFIRGNNIKIAQDYDKGCLSTGCVGCGFGIQFKDDKRLKFLYENYPKYYEMVMNFKNNGITYREALRKNAIRMWDVSSRRNGKRMISTAL